MDSQLDLMIREKLADYLVREISLEDFEDWFVSASWNVAQSNNPNAINLVYEIDLWLAEHSNGHWTEQELKDRLSPLVTNYRFDMEYSPIITVDSNAKIERVSASFDI